MKTVVGNTLHVWADLMQSPVAEAERGSGRVAVHVVDGEYSAEDAGEVVWALQEAIKFAQEASVGEAQGD